MSLRPLKQIAVPLLAVLHLASVHAQPREQLLIDGPAVVMPLVAALAKDFELRVRDVGFVFERNLGDLRLEALLQGKLDIAVVSNGINTAFISKEGMVAHKVARSAVVFAVNSGVPLGDLTRRQLCDVYDGLVSNWKSLGGPDLAIAPHFTPRTHMDTQIVRSAIECFRRLRRTEAVAHIIGQSRPMGKALAATPGAIGITSPIVVAESQGRLRSLSIDGVAPSAENVEGKRYGMVREIFFVTWSPPSSAVARFLRFVRSSEGHKLIRVNGATPAK